MSLSHTDHAFLTLGAVVAFAALAAPLAAQCQVSDTRYTVVDLGTLGGTVSSALDIDEAGRVVGSSTTADGVSHPFLWQDGVLFDLGTLGGAQGFAGAINASGQITGQSDNSQPIRRAFLYTGGEMIELPTLAGGEGRGFDLNDAGQVVGISTSASGSQHGFLYDHNTQEITDLGTFPGDVVSYANAINNANQIAGWSSASGNVNGGEAFLLDDGTRLPLGTLGGSTSIAFDLDETGRVVGWSTLAGDVTYHGFLWDGEQMTDLGDLDGAPTVAGGVHASGYVVGFSTKSASGFESFHAFLYADGEMVDLNSLIPADSGWELVTAFGVNGAGQVVGSGTIGGAADRRAFLANPATVVIGDLRDLLLGFELPHGISMSLQVKLRNAVSAIERCEPAEACSPLGALLKEVSAQAGKQLTEEQAASLLAALRPLMATLGCS